MCAYQNAYSDYFEHQFWSPSGTKKFCLFLLSLRVCEQSVRRQLPCPVGDNYLDRLTETGQDS